jgi:hypothetical protein
MGSKGLAPWRVQGRALALSGWRINASNGDRAAVDVDF